MLEKALLWMADEWYQLLEKPSKEVNTAGVIYALRTMGFSDSAKLQNKVKPMHLHFHDRDKRL